MTSVNKTVSCRVTPQVRGKINKLVKEGKFATVGDFVKFAINSALGKTTKGADRA
jgi:Arc/MetJ-type ribon-helix-helix transcriptional regulator